MKARMGMPREVPSSRSVMIDAEDLVAIGADLGIGLEIDRRHARREFHFDRPWRQGPRRNRPADGASHPDWFRSWRALAHSSVTAVRRGIRGGAGARPAPARSGLTAVAAALAFGSSAPLAFTVAAGAASERRRGNARWHYARSHRLTFGCGIDRRREQIELHRGWATVVWRGVPRAGPPCRRALKRSDARLPP